MARRKAYQAGPTASFLFLFFFFFPSNQWERALSQASNTLERPTRQAIKLVSTRWLAQGSWVSITQNKSSQGAQACAENIRYWTDTMCAKERSRGLSALICSGTFLVTPSNEQGGRSWEKGRRSCARRLSRSNGLCSLRQVDQKRQACAIPNVNMWTHYCQCKCAKLDWPAAILGAPLTISSFIPYKM